MTTRTLPAQASVSTPNGATATITHLGPAAGRDHWYLFLTHPDYCGLTIKWATVAQPDPDPMAALASTEDYVRRTCGQWIPQADALALADAIAAMWGE